MAATPLARGPMNARVSANVTRLRRKLKISQAELESRTATAGFRIPTLGLTRIERGQRRITLDEVQALASALGVTFNDLAFVEPAAVCEVCGGVPPKGFRCMECGQPLHPDEPGGSSPPLVSATTNRSEPT